MRALRFALLSAVLVAAFGASGVAAAHGGWRGGGWHGGWHSHARVGVFIGGPAFYDPFWYPPYYPPVYYYPPIVVSPPTPPVYVERSDVPPAAPAQSWYYCPDSKAYYPYVKTCPRPWQQVAPQPPTS